MPTLQVPPTRPSGRWRLAYWSGAAVLLAIPAIAMQFTPQVAWSPGDFAIFAAMLVVAGVAFELAVRHSARRIVRLILALAIVGAFLVVWAQLAVGIW